MQDMARKSLYSSIYPAVQNLLLACRAVGLAACLTTLHLMYEEPIAKLLGLPGERRDDGAHPDRLAEREVRAGEARAGRGGREPQSLRQPL